MTLPTTGALRASAINTEIGVAATTLRSLNAAASRTLAATGTRTPAPPATITNPNTIIRYFNFYGAASVIRGTATYTGNPMQAWTAYAGAWGNNPSDAGGGWPLEAWDASGSGARFTTYYPYITDAGTTNLWYTFGADDTGDLAVATTTTLALNNAQIQGLTYTAIQTAIGFPGVNNWAFLGTYTGSQVLWFRVSAADTGGSPFGVTFALSTTNNNGGRVISTRSFDGAGNPTFTR